MTLAPVMQVRPTTTTFETTECMQGGLWQEWRMTDSTGSFCFPRERMAESALIASLRTIFSAQFKSHRNELNAAKSAFSDNQEGFQSLPLSWQPYGGARIYPNRKLFQVFPRIYADIPNAFVFSQTRRNGQIFLKFNQKFMVTADCNDVAYGLISTMHSGRSSRKDRAISIKIPTDECRDVTRRKIWESQRPCLSRHNSILGQILAEWFRTNTDRYKIQTVMRISIVLDGLIGFQGDAERFQVRPVCRRQRQHQRSSHHSTIGRKKAQPVGFLIGVNGVKEVSVEPIANRAMGSHGLDVSTWTTGYQVLPGGWSHLGDF